MSESKLLWRERERIVGERGGCNHLSMENFPTTVTSQVVLLVDSDNCLVDSLHQRISKLLFGKRREQLMSESKLLWRERERIVGERGGVQPSEC